MEWSTDSKWISIEDTDHYIHLYRPDIVIHEIKEMLEKVK